jgi:hypothetical protein
LGSSRAVISASTTVRSISSGLQRSRSIGGSRGPDPRSASNLQWIELPSSRLDELLPRCEGAHKKAVLQASEGGRSPYHPYHSPGVVAFMNRTLGEHII